MKKLVNSLLTILLFFSLLISTKAVTLEEIELINLKSNFASVTEVFNDEVKVLYQKNANAKMYPASLTKILTTYTGILYGPDMNTPVTIEYSDVAGLIEADASVAGLQVGQVVTFKDLLYGSMLPSGADASNAIARVISGDLESYVELMNKTAKEIGLTNSHFVNTTGLFDEDHYSSANDINILTRTALKNDTFKEIFSALHYNAAPTQANPNGIDLSSTLLLYAQNDVSRIGYIMGGKTGWVPESGYCLSSYADFHGRSYAVVTCDAFEPGDQLEDHNLFYKFLFENKHTVTVLNENQELGKVELVYQDKPKHYVINNQDEVTLELPIVIDYNDLDSTNEFIKSIETPVEKGTEIGTYKINLADETIYEANFKFEEDIERNNFIYYFAMITNYFKSPAFIELLILIVVILLILFLGLMLLTRSRAKRNRKGPRKGYRL